MEGPLGPGSTGCQVDSCPFRVAVRGAYQTVHAFRTPSHTMTAQHTPDDSSSPSKNRATDHLRKAIEAEEMDKKNYHIRQALQLLTMSTD